MVCKGFKGFSLPVFSPARALCGCGVLIYLGARRAGMPVIGLFLPPVIQWNNNRKVAYGLR